MRLLLTGAAGFVGMHLAPALRVAGHRVVTTDIRDDTARVPIDLPEYDLLDFADTELAFHAAEKEMHGVDGVVHLAAQVGRVFGETTPDLTIRSNATMTTHVAQAAQRRHARVVYASTSEVYGDQHLGDVTERGPFSTPHNLYGLSKRWGEEAIRLYADHAQMLRLSMPYGPGLPAGRGRAALINFLWQASTGQDIVVHRGAERSWCWIGDTVAGIIRAVDRGEVWTPGHADDVGAYNVGRDDNRTSMEDVARMACRIVDGDEGRIVMVDAPDRQTVVKRLSDAKLRRIGWKPTTGLENGMRQTWLAIRDTLPAAPR